MFVCFVTLCMRCGVNSYCADDAIVPVNTVNPALLVPEITATEMLLRGCPCSQYRSCKFRLLDVRNV